MKAKPDKLTLVILILLPTFILYSCPGDTLDIDHCDVPVNLEVVQSWDSVIGQNTGSILVEATRGNGDFEYSLNGGPFQSSGEWVDLAGGDYTVTVRDRQGCSASISVTLKEVEVPSFANDIMPIVESHCAIVVCHVRSGPAPFEMRDYSDVIPYIREIRTTVINRTMPPPRRTTLSATQIASIVNWIDGGAPNN